MARYENFLKHYRQYKGIRQRKLAEMLDVDSAYVSAWETGRALPPIDTRIKIAEILEQPIEKVFP